MNVSRTFNVPAAKRTVAKKVFDAVGQGAQGMFPATIVDGQINPGTGTPVAYCSSGVIDDQNPVVQGRAAVKALTLEGVTEAEIDEVFDALDLTPSDPFVRAKEVSAEVDATISAADWVQSTGAEDAYPFDAVVKHNGKLWKCLQAENPFEPGVASWREVWGTSTDTPPAWVQPTGSTDFYPLGARVTHLGDTWVSTLAVNSWEPGVTGWSKETTAPEPWSLGGGSGTSGSYNLGDRVTHPNPEESNASWIWQSGIPANTTEPGAFPAFNYWIPIGPA